MAIHDRYRGGTVKAAIKKWGNSAAVRIPAAVLQTARMEVDEAVEVREESGRIVIEPVRRKDYKLADLVRGITAGNQHAEIDWGGPAGKEVW
jgi:antitoxin MazE